MRLLRRFVEGYAPRARLIGKGSSDRRLASILLLASRRGPLDPATLGAAASSAPDLEHILPFLRPRGRKVFNGRLGWHRSGRFPADLQLLLAGVILGTLIVPRRRDV